MQKFAPTQKLQSQMNYPPKVQENYVPPHYDAKLQSSEKRYQFYLSIKESKKQKMFQEVRRLNLLKEHNESLTQLIEKTKQCINMDQMIKLFNFARRGMRNAVIHIGNLFIQGALDFRVFAVVGTDWLNQIPTTCGYFQWLLLVLIGKNVVDFTYFTYLRMIKQLCQPNKPIPQLELRALNSMKCITFLLRNHSETFLPILLVQWDLINFSHLLSFTNSTNYQLSKHCYRLIGELLCQQNDLTLGMIQSHFDYKKIISIIKAGVLSVHSFIRAICCQIFNNITWLLRDNCQREVIHELFGNFCNLLNHEKQKISVKLQVSYLMVNYIVSCSLEQICDNVVHGMIKSVKQLSSQRYQCEEEIQLNFVAIKKYLNQLCFSFQIESLQEQEYIKRITWQLSSQGLLIQDFQI